jgi:diguanylate cyclase (GGDEF)-like protein/PAS domain S-box-containing protein
MGQEALAQRIAALRAVVDDASDLISLHDLDSRYLYANQAAARAVGHKPEDLAGKSFEQAGFPAHICKLFAAAFEDLRNKGKAGELEFEAPLVGGTQVLQSQFNPVHGTDGTLAGFLVVTRDATRSMRAQAVRDSQDQVMRLIVSGASLEQLMQAIVHLAEKNTPGRLCSLLLLTPDGHHLARGHAPNLPAELIESLTQRPLGADNGCCGKAAATETLAVAQDIAADPGWAAHRDIALRHGLRACWSEPIIASDGELLGTFAMYHKRARAPYERELQVVKEGALIAAVAIQHCRARERLHDALAGSRESEERLNRALSASALGMWDWNIETGDLYVDRHMARMMGYPLEAMSPKLDWLLQRVHPEDLSNLLNQFSAHLKGLTSRCDIDFRAQMQSGAWKWLHLRGQVTQRRADGWALRMTGTNKDIEDQKRMQTRLERATKRVELLLDATDEGIIGLDEAGACTFVNPAALRILDCKAEDLLGHDFAEIVRHTAESGEELIGHDSPIHRCLTEGQRYRSSRDDIFLRGGHPIPVDFAVSPISTGKESSGAVLVFHDVSEKRTLQQQLHHQALHDPLTGLMNRRGFEARLNEFLLTAKEDDRRHALCYLDLDQFKVVNDTCGHVAGDELLRQLPDILKAQVRERDLIARLGGDEFGLLLEDCPLDAAARIAEKVRDAVRDFRFVWQYRSFAVGASIGIVGITAESQGPMSVLAAADAACYVAKDQGSNHVYVSHPHDLTIIRRRGEMRWVARLRQAIEDNQFRLHYQSIAALDAPDKAPRSHELLIRLVDAKGDLILPGAFLPAAERYRLMATVDQWVIENALRYLGEFIAPDPVLCTHHFGINLSAESLRDESLLERIKEALARHRVPASMIYFEITETAAIANLSAATGIMRRIKELGCRLALDDFGSGMSSFSYLKNLPVDYLKIDGAFIKDIVSNRVDQAIVRAAQAVALELNIATVAEYAESDAIVACLRGMGVNYAQGYAIARPIALEQFAAQQQQRAAG